MSDYVMRLRKEARAKDRSLFTDWMERRITTDQAIASFKENNKMNEFVIINANDFEIWLRSLGYKRSRIS